MKVVKRQERQNRLDSLGISLKALIQATWAFPVIGLILVELAIGSAADIEQRGGTDWLASNNFPVPAQHQLGPSTLGKGYLPSGC